MTRSGTDNLPAPSPNKMLKVLAVARGFLTYSCVGVDPMLEPRFVSQDTSLWDAAPLVQSSLDEDALHQFIPQLYDYDYASLTNSTLDCIGNIYTEEKEEVVNLNDATNFQVHVNEVVEPPEDAAFNAHWAHSTNLDATWDIYRVETYGGAAPPHCGGQEETIIVGYAAEYWFYHT